MIVRSNPTSWFQLPSFLLYVQVHIHVDHGHILSVSDTPTRVTWDLGRSCKAPRAGVLNVVTQVLMTDPALHRP
jgi:hypothetical protein